VTQDVRSEGLPARRHRVARSVAAHDQARADVFDYIQVFYKSTTAPLGSELPDSAGFEEQLRAA
jgi:hypothetical protein